MYWCTNANHRNLTSGDFFESSVLLVFAKTKAQQRMVLLYVIVAKKYVPGLINATADSISVSENLNYLSFRMKHLLKWKRGYFIVIKRISVLNTSSSCYMHIVQVHNCDCIGHAKVSKFLSFLTTKLKDSSC